MVSTCFHNKVATCPCWACSRILDRSLSPTLDQLKWKLCILITKTHTKTFAARCWARLTRPGWCQVELSLVLWGKVFFRSGATDWKFDVGLCVASVLSKFPEPVILCFDSCKKHCVTWYDPIFSFMCVREKTSRSLHCVAFCPLQQAFNCSKSSIIMPRLFLTFEHGTVCTVRDCS